MFTNRLITRHRLLIAVAFALAGVIALTVASRPDATAAAEPDAAPGPRVVASSNIEAGRYLVKIAGCNDCHTANFDITGGNVPEEQWLLGTGLGWRGPWGTTYASNLRLHVQEFDDADTWIMVMRARKDRPPMPWPSIHAMGDEDLRAIYHFIRSLGPAGEKMPDYVPPDVEPTTPFRSLMPVTPATVVEASR